MLTKQNLGYSFYSFSFLSKACRFPAQFHRSSGSFQISRGGLRRPAFQVNLLLFTANALVVSGRTFEAGAISHDLPLEHLALGIIGSSCYLAMSVVGFIVHQKLETQVMLWNELMRRVEQEGRLGQSHRKTWSELYICYFTLPFWSTLLMVPVMYWVNPDLPFLLYQNVPRGFKSTPLAILCCLGDVALCTFCLSLAIYIVVFVMLFILKMEGALQSLQDKIDKIGTDPYCSSKWVRITPQPVQLLDVEARVGVNVKNNSKIQPTVNVISEVRGKAKLGPVTPTAGELTGREEDQERTGKKSASTEHKEDVEKEVKSKEKRPVRREAKWKIKRRKRWAKASVWPTKTEGKLAVKEEKVSTVNIEMQSINKEEEDSDAGRLKAACSALEYLNLQFRLFNEGFAYTVFISKLLCLAVPTLSAFVCIRLAKKNQPEFAFLNGLLTVVVVLNYIGMYNNAFHLTGQAEKCKAKILIKSSALLKDDQITKLEWNAFRCRVAAIPRLAVYSGFFHILERDSTIIFLNFMLAKLADLLLTF